MEYIFLFRYRPAQCQFIFNTTRCRIKHTLYTIQSTHLPQPTTHHNIIILHIGGLEFMSSCPSLVCRAHSSIYYFARPTSLSSMSFNRFCSIPCKRRGWSKPGTIAAFEKCSCSDLSNGNTINWQWKNPYSMSWWLTKNGKIANMWQNRRQCGINGVFIALLSVKLVSFLHLD